MPSARIANLGVHRSMDASTYLRVMTVIGMQAVLNLDLLATTATGQAGLAALMQLIFNMGAARLRAAQ